MSGVLKGIAKSALGAIPGVGGIASSIFDGIAGSGNQGGQTQSGSSTSTSSSATNASSNQQYNGNAQQTEDPMMSMFRLALGSQFGQAFDDANTPVFGEGAKASFVNQLNDLSNSSFDSLSNNLAKRGVTNSGAMSEGAAGLENARFGNLSQFFANLPFQESQAKSSKVNNLLGLATNFVGPALRGQTTSGDQTGTSASTTTGNSSTQSQGNVTNNGAPFGTNLAAGLGAATGTTAAGGAPGLINTGWLNNLWQPKYNT